MLAVHLDVTGASYRVGDIPPGQNRSVHVRPAGESGIELRYDDPIGVAQSLSVECYLEPGYEGFIEIAVRHHQVISRFDEVSPYRW
jgi:hypothetical protein